MSDYSGNFKLRVEIEIDAKYVPFGENEEITCFINNQIKVLNSENLKSYSLQEYLEKQLPGAVDNLIKQLSYYEYNLLPFRGALVNTAVKRIVAQNDKEIRKRLNRRRGAASKRFSLPLMFDGYPGIKKYKSAYKTLKEQGETITKTKLANIVFADKSNPLKSLRDELRKFGIDFDRLIEFCER